MYRIRHICPYKLGEFHAVQPRGKVRRLNRFSRLRTLRLPPFHQESFEGYINPILFVLSLNKNKFIFIISKLTVLIEINGDLFRL